MNAALTAPAIQALRHRADKLVAKDVASDNHSQGGRKAAWTRLTVGNELLTAAQVEERFAAQGLEITLNAAAEHKLKAVQNFPHGVVPIVQANDELSAPRIDVNNGSSLHVKGLSEGCVAIDTGTVQS